ncbi:MAG TPA: tRNA pseudouridine(55) synthase TruB [Terriglobia bacterium]|jgi:tRNA pseudouridine55 synthase|nr:tRNA pseudouridine(55) synthase TruB [Terriglobia bacterium]
MTTEPAAAALPLRAAPELAGVLLIDKPAGMTSHDVVAAVRRILRVRQVGHFGTLDPFATGVLPLSIGKATRFAQFYLKSRKAYCGAIHFGFATDTYDATGVRAAEPVECRPQSAEVERVFAEFTGRIKQTPPPFSAKRVKGVRAYELARRRETVELEPVEVEVYAFELMSLEGAAAQFAVECSGGTYVRSLAHDAGRKLGCPAHLASLRRTAVAEFAEGRAVSLATMERAASEGEAAKLVIPLEALLPDCPALVVRGREEQDVRHGRSFELAQALRADRGLGPDAAGPAITLLKVMNGERRLIAVARRVAGNVYHPDLVLA